MLISNDLSSATLESIARQVDNMGRGHENASDLISLLIESSAAYTNRNPRECARLKGYILSSFARIGLPDRALPIVFEELEVGDNPYVVAAAARAIRGSNPNASFTRFLLQAIRNFSHMDDFVSFESFRPQYPLKNPTSVLSESIRTLEWLGIEARGFVSEIIKLADSNDFRIPSAQRQRLLEIAKVLQRHSSDAGLSHTCCAMLDSQQASEAIAKTVCISIRAEDQNGQPLCLEHFMADRPTVIAFFYTRCGNPRKCSAAVTKLAQLQKKLDHVQLPVPPNILAISYDPAFDLPMRMRAFGKDRGFAFGERAKFARVTEGFEQLRHALDLCVGYSGSLVNQHATELFVVDSRSRIVANYSRQPWQTDEIVSVLRAVCVRRPLTRLIHASGGFSGVLTSFFIAFLPKCPFCWSVYLSAFGITALQSTLAWRGVAFVSTLAFALHLFVVYRQCRSAQFWWPLAITTVGIALLGGSIFVSALSSYRLLGLAIVLFASSLGQWSMTENRLLTRFPKLRTISVEPE